MIIKLPAQLLKVDERADGSSKLTFESRELSEEEFLIARRIKNTEGWLIFSQNVIRDDEIPDDDAPSDLKTPAQRLRAVLFIRWKNLGEPNTFQHYYDKSVEFFINEVKAKLE